MRRLDQSRTATVKQAGHFREEFRSLMGNMTHDLKTVRAAVIQSHYSMQCHANIITTFVLSADSWYHKCA